MAEFLASKYLKIVGVDGNKRDLIGHYLDYPNDFNLNDKPAIGDYFVGLSHDVILEYRKKSYSYSDYEKYLQEFHNMQFIDLTEIPNKYLNILFRDLFFHHNHARFNLLHSAPFILDNFNFNFKGNVAYHTKNGKNDGDFFIGVHSLRNISTLTACVSYAQLLDKLFHLLYCCLKHEEITDGDFASSVKDINSNGVRKLVDDFLATENTHFARLERSLIKTFYDKLNELSNWACDNRLVEISNQFKHRGLLIEEGLKYECIHTKKTSNGYEIIKENIFDNGTINFCHYDLDKINKLLREFNNKLCELINNDLSNGMLRQFKGALFNMGYTIVDELPPEFTNNGK